MQFPGGDQTDYSTDVLFVNGLPENFLHQRGGPWAMRLCTLSWPLALPKAPHCASSHQVAPASDHLRTSAAAFLRFAPAAVPSTTWSNGAGSGRLAST